MNRNRGIKLALAALIGAVVAVHLSSCSSKEVVSNSKVQQLGLNRIAVMPFRDMTKTFGQNVDIRCELCGKTFTTGEVAAGADEFMTRQTIILLQNRSGFLLVPPDQAYEALQDVMLGNQEQLQEKEILLEAGRFLDADALLVGHIYRFRERVGNQYSVEQPASVNFDLDLVRVLDGQTLWDGSYDETQQPLFENLFKIGAFFKRKGKWVTAEELASSGLEKVLETLPKP